MNPQSVAALVHLEYDFVRIDASMSDLSAKLAHLKFPEAGRARRRLGHLRLSLQACLAMLDEHITQAVKIHEADSPPF